MATQDKKLQDEVKDSAHRIWLAGLGALSAAEEEGSKLFARLVERGKGFEAEGKEQFSKAKKKAEKVYEDVTETLDDKVTAALHRLGVPTRDEIKRLTKKVEELTAKVEQLKPKAASATVADDEKKAPARKKAE
ncbi:MAG TPA: phasin family protein [Thermoanaerobaculia bacterium]|jgi:polyhydroxyalkanoate synthesis regulator phasin|nr:phasin family protein [Thermoanaerobaculia bacterium]